ncbi:tetratricopeptide repeat protein [Azospirillum sp. YIM DDC1]|uniref:Tetratricopeptide repeat protein n=1 Tax=Azospirillum aestuarii TaxID=2802052 RepID=A0ABS1I433_9PROT|nr:tetratricopeptide repeat-containing glycosyltransferase family protein [Azospirillum aestuarii]MBK3774436.1 tetratricopeptide repeat protein [Azospirillum brasilense]MBK4721836.1 tetratricopeptide repeat protein [Azospirillum aestuarii]TWA85958.1 tetratricopeptide repeat protein [Azospirillum brasilense]
MATLLDVLDAAVNHHMAGRLAEAAQDYRVVLAVEPAQPDALHLLGVAEAQSGAHAAAAALIARSLRLRPDAAAPWGNLGGALRVLGAAERADAVLTRALALDPALADALTNLGSVRHALADHPAALAWLERAERLRPGHPDTALNRGVVLRDARRFAESDACLDALLASRPDHADAHLARAVSRLVRGDLRAGWDEFEWRPRRLPAPPWAGEPLEGRRILLHAEQGFGDTIQFARYAPLVARAGGRVILDVHPLQFRLLRSLGPEIQVLVRGPAPAPHDLHCPLMSLPRAFGTDLTSIPAPPAYLAAEADEVARWGRRIAEVDTGTRSGPRVGLVWAGNPNHRNDRNRSIPVERLAPLLDTPGLRLFSLQTGDPRADRPAALPDLTAGIRDFADSAAILENLDLVIAVDTATIHLAGALGVPAWLLLPYAPDWRWLLDRTDSPWYPSLRLFRQPHPGDWDSVLRAVATELERFAADQLAPQKQS